eukprot:GHVP01026386.1.p1 GENE.GHVP01026386.1~~GHVP01026386.1.p1  ORF type:complete len:429 (-),score=82.57 GHVP01026386.1:1117-2403(-)
MEFEDHLRFRENARTRSMSIKIFLLCIFAFFLTLLAERTSLFQNIFMNDKTDIFFFGMKNRNVTVTLLSLLRMSLILILALFVMNSIKTKEEQNPFKFPNRINIKSHKRKPWISQNIVSKGIPPRITEHKEEEKKEDLRPSNRRGGILDIERWAAGLSKWRESTNKILKEKVSINYGKIERICPEKSFKEFGCEDRMDRKIEQLKDNIFDKIIVPLASSLNALDKEIEEEKNKSRLGVSSFIGNIGSRSSGLSVAKGVTSREAFPFKQTGNIFETAVEQKRSKILEYILGDNKNEKNKTIERVKKMARTRYIGRTYLENEKTDVEIIFHIIITYLDSTVPTIDSLVEQPFSKRFIHIGDHGKVFDDNEYRIRLCKEKVPNFSFCVGGKIYETRSGPKGMFEAFIYFIRYCEINNEGFAGHTKVSDIFY